MGNRNGGEWNIKKSVYRTVNLIEYQVIRGVIAERLRTALPTHENYVTDQ